MKTPLAAALAAVVASPACGEVIISEIFYNLNGSENGVVEWVEITNTGSSEVDLSGWIYGDDQDGAYSDPFSAGTALAAGASAVITGQDPSTFQSIWGPDIQVINFLVEGANTGISLANGASATNETPAIFDASNTLVDAANYENGTGGWPSGNGQSIYLLPNRFTPSANDVGANWGTSTAGLDGAYAALIVNPDIDNASTMDVASPGFAAIVPEPTTVLLAAVALAGAAARRV
ncbi:lamin tail domain-containing protein [Botrimarina sp.]|uniref:lamin tail domain-containing protein n=1 Tax=Botrimarina sp. TaxID=2795802 RepID=UPI0032EEAFB7